MEISLVAHIVTATTTLMISTIAWFRPTYTMRVTLRTTTALSVLSGMLLVFEPDQLTRTFCIKLGVYLLLIALTEYRLHKTLDQTSPSIV
jgi:hypothetical protein